MAIAHPELAATLSTVTQVEPQVLELDVLQLALVGGGVGEVVLA